MPLWTPTHCMVKLVVLSPLMEHSTILMSFLPPVEHGQSCTVPPNHHHRRTLDRLTPMLECCFGREVFALLRVRPMPVSILSKAILYLSPIVPPWTSRARSLWRLGLPRLTSRMALWASFANTTMP